MKKSDRIQAFVANLDTDPDSAADPRYLGWFTCFNAGHYYEAHDVLEHLWLQTTGPDALFYKALIQLAGAYVHLRKHSEHPTHPKHTTRLRPAARLFRLAAKNLAPFAPRHHHLDVAATHTHCERLAHEIEATHHTRNPWAPDTLPQITLTEPAQ